MYTLIRVDARQLGRTSAYCTRISIGPSQRMPGDLSIRGVRMFTWADSFGPTKYDTRLSRLRHGSGLSSNLVFQQVKNACPAFHAGQGSTGIRIKCVLLSPVPLMRRCTLSLSRIQRDGSFWTPYFLIWAEAMSLGPMLSLSGPEQSLPRAWEGTPTRKTSFPRGCHRLSTAQGEVVGCTIHRVSPAVVRLRCTHALALF